MKFLPDRILLWIIGGLLLLASTVVLFQPAELLVAWGDDGSLPAVCYSSCPIPGSRQFTVLCPGGSNAASQLLHALDKRGCGRLESIFSSMTAPSPRGTRVLLKKKPTAELIVFADARRRTSGMDLPAEARSAGVAVRERFPASAIESSRHQHWKYCSKREKNGDMHWSFHHLKDQVEITLSWQKNGMLELQCQDRHGSRITRQFPRSNRCGTWGCRLGCRGQGAGCRGQGASVFRPCSVRVMISYASLCFFMMIYAFLCKCVLQTDLGLHCLSILLQ